MPYYVEFIYFREKDIQIQKKIVEFFSKLIIRI